MVQRPFEDLKLKIWRFFGGINFTMDLCCIGRFLLEQEPITSDGLLVGIILRSLKEHCRFVTRVPISAKDIKGNILVLSNELIM